MLTPIGPGRKKCVHCFCGFFALTDATIQLNPLEPDIEKAEKAFSSFHADLAKAPWLPVKREIQKEFKKYRDELTKLKEKLLQVASKEEIKRSKVGPAGLRIEKLWGEKKPRKLVPALSWSDF
uniref:FH2 domain-containing protein n=1 Tax=Globodera pallida TaxID=36090 RepID=A0A183CDL9_GLOPA